MPSPRASFVVSVTAGKKAQRQAETRARAPRREPDAATSKMFGNIHRNKDRFSVTAVSKAFAKARKATVG